LLGAFFLYFPALFGAFVLDDWSLPLGQAANRQSFTAAIAGLRPVLMASYWLNCRLWGDAPVSYHVVNFLIHAINSGLVFFILRRLLEMANWERSKGNVAAAIGAVVFLIHPLQTESVSYIAGRSESLASLFLLLAYTVFLYRRHEEISWRAAIAVLVLFGLAVKTKENAVSLAGILLLTDLMWPKAFSLEGPRKNWRLYLLMLPGVALAAFAIFRMLATAGTAGFSVGSFKWYEYSFTEARAIFTYIRLAILPMGQSLDHDFATSHTIFERGAIVYMALLFGLVALAIRWRHKFPLSCFGLLMFLVWLAPTSSVVPIDDALVERRMYLAMIGLILIACESVQRWELRTPAVTALVTVTLVAFGAFCYERNKLWGSPETLVAMAAAEAKHNPRPMLNFADFLIQHDHCDQAVPYLARAERILPNSYFVKASWGRTLACLGHPQQALLVLQQAAAIQPCSQVYEWIGLVYGGMGRLAEARAAIEKSIELNPRSAEAHSAMALWYESVHDLDSAEQEYRRSLELDPAAPAIRAYLQRVAQLRSNRPADRPPLTSN
jgi:Flp pilus assembly protein TadD